MRGATLGGMNFDKIVVPTDFSPASDAAVAAAVELAARLGHDIVLLHAFTPPIYPLLDGAVIPTAEHVADLVTQADRQLDALCARYAHKDVTIEPKLVQGAAACGGWCSARSRRRSCARRRCRC